MSELLTKYEHRSVQQEALEATQAARREGIRSGLLNMATGLGKTYVAACDVKDFLRENPEARVLYLCHQNDILTQAHETFDEVLGDEVSHGYAFGGQLEDQKQVVYASFQTMNSSFEGVNLYEMFDPNEFDYIIDDESHHALAPSYRRVLEHFNPQFLLGLSATPERRDGLDIMDMFEVELYRKTLEDALAEGLLSPVIYKTFTDRVRSLLENGETIEGITIEQLNKVLFIPRRDEEIAQILFDEIAQHEDPHAMFFCQSIEHAERMADLLPGAVAIHSGNNPELQRKMINAFKSGEIPVACVVDKFNEGVDLPNVNFVGFLRSTSSMRVWLQQLGRGLRPVEGKEAVTVIDLAADVERITMVLELMERVENKRKDKPEPIFVEANPAVKYEFSEEARKVIDLIKTVRANMLKKQENFKHRILSPLVLSVNNDYVRRNVTELVGDQPRDIFLKESHVLYLSLIFESPHGYLDEERLAHAHKIQFRKPMTQQQIHERLKNMEEVGLVEQVAFRKGDKNRKLWRITPDAVAGMAEKEPYKTEHDQALAAVHSEIHRLQQEAEAHGLQTDGFFIRSSEGEILEFTHNSEEQSGLDSYSLNYHPGGDFIMETDLTTFESKMTIMPVVDYWRETKRMDMPLKGSILISQDKAEPIWTAEQEHWDELVWRRMTAGELNAMQEKLSHFHAWKMRVF